MRSLFPSRRLPPGTGERSQPPRSWRPAYVREDWLIVVCTDHGGREKDHGHGEHVPDIRTGLLILQGPAVRAGRIPGATCNADVAATALTHLGVPIKPEWKLDGRAVGLRK
jgi:hypothetical protein